MTSARDFTKYVREHFPQDYQPKNGDIMKTGDSLSPFNACWIVEGYIDRGDSYGEEEILEAWQYLVDTDIAWELQGWYGRTATALIEAGLIYRK